MHVTEICTCPKILLLMTVFVELRARILTALCITATSTCFHMFFATIRSLKVILASNDLYPTLAVAYIIEYRPIFVPISRGETTQLGIASPLSVFVRADSLPRSLSLLLCLLRSSAALSVSLCLGDTGTGEDLL